MKRLGISYFLCALGVCTPLAGLHRFYLDRPITGLLYLLTWGFCGIGTVFDLIRLPTIVDAENYRLLRGHNAMQYGEPPHIRSKQPVESAILRCAKRNGGTVTVPMVAMETSITLDEAERALESMRKASHCTLDADGAGSKIYQFVGLSAQEPLEMR